MAPPTKKRKKSSAVEEVTFNPEDRQDYLTGFHKRKLQRIKQAQDAAAKKEREERLEDRKKLRESRKEEAQRHVEAVNAMVRRAERGDVSSAEETASESEEWEGFPETAPEPVVDHEEEYMDDDRHTTVTVESIDVSRDGFQPVQDDSSSNDEPGATKPAEAARVAPARAKRTRAAGEKRVWTKEKPVKPKTKKKKFRYESKADRKTTRAKERSGNKAKAKARRD